MVPAECKNPFHTHKADDTLVVPAGDVPDLHAHALAKCDEALAQARRTGASAGLLVVGEAGGGKSHLIAQLRRQLAGDPAAALAAIRLGKAYSGRLWRHLRERLVEELLLPYAPWGQPGNGLLRVLRNRFPAWGHQDDLAPHLDEFAASTPIDYNLATVLPRLGSVRRTRVAQDWLRGRLLAASDLTHLGLPAVLPSEQEQEVQAQDVVMSLLRLAGDRTTLMLCFDEVEAIQAGTWDTAVLRQFTTLATSLLAEPGPRVVVTCVRPRLLTEMVKAVESSNVQKIRQDSATIYPLELDEAKRVVVARLDAEPTCRAARAARPAEPYWPLGEAFVEATFARLPRALTPRHLITACRDEFDRLQKGRPARPSALGTTPRPRVPLTPEQFAHAWSGLRGRHLDAISAVPFDSVVGVGLPWLVRLATLPYDLVGETPATFPDIDLLFQPRYRRAEKPIGLSLCNHEPRVLWMRLDRVKQQWEAARGAELQSLVVLRSEAERTTDNGKSRLQELRGQGVRVVLLDRQQLAELAAFQVMMTKALEGKLLNHGLPIDPSEYDAWARANLSDAVKELLHQIFEPDPARCGPRSGPAAARK